MFQDITSPHRGLSMKYHDQPSLQDKTNTNEKDKMYLFSDEDDEFATVPPPGERLAPVGGNAEEEGDGSCNKINMTVSKLSKEDSFENFVDSRLDVGGGNGNARDAGHQDEMNPKDAKDAGKSVELERRIMEMEEEQEELNSSLMEMTSHFAKVINCM